MLYWSMAGIRACSRKNECASVTAYVCLQATAYTVCPGRNMAAPFQRCRRFHCTGCHQATVLDLHGFGVGGMFKILYAFLRHFEPYFGHYGHDDHFGLNLFYENNSTNDLPLFKQKLGDLDRGSINAVVFLNVGREDNAPLARAIRDLVKTINSRTGNECKMTKVTLTAPESKYDPNEARPLAFHCMGWPQVNFEVDHGHHYLRFVRLDFTAMHLHKVPLAIGRG